MGGMGVKGRIGLMGLMRLLGLIGLTNRAYAAYGILCTSSTSWLMNIAACSLNRSGDSDVK